MPNSKQERNQALNSFSPPTLHSMLQTPLFAIWAEMNGAFMESVATAQKDWMDFVQQRVREDVAVSRQLMRCQSLPEWHQVYAEYLSKTLEQYKEQSSEVVQRGQAVAEHIAEATENGKESARARH